MHSIFGLIIGYLTFKSNLKNWQKYFIILVFLVPCILDVFSIFGENNYVIRTLIILFGAICSLILLLNTDIRTKG
jgi:hypothetical protein